jgi:hypothetical protein
MLAPQYNILKTAGSSFGFTASEETRARLSEARKGERNPMFIKSHTTETRARMSDSRIGNTNAPSISVTILDLSTGETSVYPSIWEAARSLNTDATALSRLSLRKNPDKPFRNRYIINIHRNDEY